jgi:energy-coupling factor transporter transmembrane protein EcfT
MFGSTLLGFMLSTIWAIIVLIVWIAIAFWPARVAGRKGHSFFGYFLLSLLFFPLALILAYLVDDRSSQYMPSDTLVI